MAKIIDNMLQPDGHEKPSRIVAGLVYAGGGCALASTWGPLH